MVIRTRLNETNAVYFVTITCFNWINLFEITNFYPFIYRWFNFMIAGKKKIIGYVIMPNHMHLLIYIPEDSEEINKVIGEGKRFMAYDMVKALTELNLVKLQDFLHESVFDFEKIRGKKHQVFRPNSDIKLCYDEDIIIQKLDYIHHNPVSGKWNLVDDYIEYPHSSAAFYELGAPGHIRIFHYKDVWE